MTRRGASAFTTTRLLAAWLFGVGPSDRRHILIGDAILFGVVLLASYFPARRAIRWDSVTPIRYE